MHAGRLEQAGPRLDLFDRPANAFVAGFIGLPAMNLLPALASGGRVTLADGTTSAGTSGHSGPVSYSIRPEHLDLIPPEAPHAVTGSVGLIKSTGTAMFVEVHSQGPTLHALFTDRPTLQRGDRIGLCPRPGFLQLGKAAGPRRGRHAAGRLRDGCAPIARLAVSRSAFAPATLSRHWPTALDVVFPVTLEAYKTPDRDLLAFVVLLPGVVLMVGPILWAISTSLNPAAEPFDMRLIPATPSLADYPKMFELMPFHLLLWNPIKIAAISTFGQLLTRSMAAFVFAVLRYPGRNVRFVLLLIPLMIPAQITAIPQFIIFKTLGLYGTQAPLCPPSELEKTTLTVGLAFFQTQCAGQWPFVMAAALVSVASMILVFILAQSHFVNGIAAAGLK